MDASERQVLGQGLLEEMARSLSIPVPQLLVNDKRQNHSLKDGKLRRKVYGTYKAGNIASVIRRRYERPCLPRRHSWIPLFMSLCIIMTTMSSNSQRVYTRQAFITGLEMWWKNWLDKKLSQIIEKIETDLSFQKTWRLFSFLVVLQLAKYLNSKSFLPTTILL